MNTQIKHTPGPWAVEPRQWDHGASLAIVAPNNGYIVAIVPFDEDIQTVDEPDYETVKRHPDEVPNAALIAAAPAMYEALLSILPATDIVSGQETDNCRWCGRDYTDHAVETGETLELCSSDDCPGYIARAALAQAEGGEG